MKQTSCPMKGDRCWSYGACEDCTWSKILEKIKRQKKQIKKLKEQANGKPTAKWENANTPASYKCSSCGGAPMYSKPEHAPEQYNRVFLTLSKFCPHCGAEMASPTDDDEDDESEEERKNGGV